MSLVFRMIAGAADGWVFVTGLMPFVGSSLDTPYPEGIEAQTRQAPKNLQVVRAGCGLGLKQALSVRIYLTHFADDCAAMNAVYAGHFAGTRRGVAASFTTGPDVVVDGTLIRGVPL